MKPQAAILKYLALSTILCRAIVGLAQATPNPCSPELLVGVAGGRDGRLVPEFTIASFTASVKKKPVTIASIDYDQGERRIILVVDRGSKMNDPAKALTKAIVSRLLSNARSQDSFALIATGRNPVRVPFGSPPSDVLAKLDSTGTASETIGVLDAVAEAAGWFQSPRRGDALLVFSGDDKFADSRANFNKTLDMLQEHGIRVFAMLFGYIQMGTYYSFFTGAPQSPISSSVSREQEDLRHLAYLSGGYLSVENTHDVWHTYKLDDTRTKQVVQTGWQLYGGIAMAYVLRFPTTVDDVRLVKIGLTADAKNKVPDAIVVQSRNASSCNGPSGNTGTGQTKP